MSDYPTDSSEEGEISIKSTAKQSTFSWMGRHQQVVGSPTGRTAPQKGIEKKKAFVTPQPQQQPQPQAPQRPQQPPQPRQQPPTPRPKFTEKFSAARLKEIKEEASRGVLGGVFTGGRGDFNEPYQKTKKIIEKYSDYLSGAKDPSIETLPAMLASLQDLDEEARGWLDSDRVAKKPSSKTQKTDDDITRAKQTACAEMTDTANAALEQFRSLHAEKLANQTTPSKPASGGTSDVKLIRDGKGDVAYAFKSIAGESDMMGTPKGFATAREVMMSKMCEGIKTQCGLDFRWPKAGMAKVGNQSGALIDGVKGNQLNPNDIASVKPEAIQKVLLCNLAMGQYDIKPEDIYIDGKSGEATPMDGGAAMPDSMTALTFLLAKGDAQPGNNLLADPKNGSPTKAAKTKMDGTIVKQFLSIDVTALEALARAEADGLQKDHGLNSDDLGLGTGQDSGISLAATSIRGIQAILKGANGNITLEDFMAQYQKTVIQDQFIKPNKAAWEQLQTRKYQQFLTQYPQGLFPPADSLDAVDMAGKYMATDQIKVWDELAALAQPKTSVELLQIFGFATPIPADDILGVRGMKKIRAGVEQIKNPAKAYAKLVEKYSAHGNLFPDFGSFAKPEDAYFEVLDPSQEYGVTQLVDFAKNAGRPLPDFLLLFGIKIPTTRYRDHYQAVQAILMEWKENINSLKLNLQEELKKNDTPELRGGLDLVDAALKHITAADRTAYLGAVQKIEGILGPALKKKGQ